MFTRSIPRSALFLSGCVGVVLALLAFTGLAQQNKKDEPKPKEVEAGQICICPVAKMFEHNGYCTYYSLKCDNTTMLGPCPWDGSCDTTSLTSGCGCTNCISSAMLAGVQTKATAGLKGLKSGGSEDALKRDGYGKNGAKPKHKHNKTPKASTDPSDVKGKRTLLGHFTIRYPLVSNSSIKVAAQVFVFSFFPDDPTTVSPGIIAFGHEIDLEGEDPDIEVTTGVVVLGDHCHEVTVKGLAYQIITHWGTTADPVTVPVPVP